MKRILKLTYVVALTIITVEIYSQASASDWSEITTPRLNWYAAQDKCKSLGMRLPSEDELKIAYQKGVTEKWSYGGIVWTSSIENDPRYENGRKRARTFDRKFGGSYWEDPKNGGAATICIR